MHKNTTFSVILGRRLVATFSRDIVVRSTRIQTFVNKTVTSCKPSNEVLVIHVIDEDLEMLVGFGEL